MIVYPNCKINLGINVLEKRTDGYHNLETVFYPIPLTDILEIIENKDPEKSPTFPLTTSGLPVKGSIISNLCVKAWKLLKKDFHRLPRVKIHLHKTIPIGAGLGGGSTDGAFALKVLNQLFKLELSDERLMEYAAILGSDCPFFILNKPCYATGRGEILKEIKLDLSAYKFVVVNPGIHINTGDAFRDIKPAYPDIPLMDIINGPIERWKDNLKNDFEKTIFALHKDIVEVKDELYRMEAIYASMSGSGSTVFGIFPKDQSLKFRFPENYFVKELI